MFALLSPQPSAQNLTDGSPLLRDPNNWNEIKIYGCCYICFNITLCAYILLFQYIFRVYTISVEIEPDLDKDDVRLNLLKNDVDLVRTKVSLLTQDLRKLIDVEELFNTRSGNNENKDQDLANCINVHHVENTNNHSQVENDISKFTRFFTNCYIHKTWKTKNEFKRNRNAANVVEQSNCHSSKRLSLLKKAEDQSLPEDEIKLKMCDTDFSIQKCYFLFIMQSGSLELFRKEFFITLYQLKMKIMVLNNSEIALKNKGELKKPKREVQFKPLSMDECNVQCAPEADTLENPRSGESICQLIILRGDVVKQYSGASCKVAHSRPEVQNWNSEKNHKHVALPTEVSEDFNFPCLSQALNEPSPTARRHMSFHREQFPLKSAHTKAQHCQANKSQDGTNISKQALEFGAGEVEDVAKVENDKEEAAAMIKPILIETAPNAIFPRPNKIKGLRNLLPTTRGYMTSRRRQFPQNPITVDTYPISRVRGVALAYMRHEFLRLCSFAKQRNIGLDTQWFTQLAHYGFYNVGGSGMMRCYSCAQEYPNGLQSMPFEAAHKQGCNWQQTNVHLVDGSPKISYEEFRGYLKEYGCGWSHTISHNNRNTYDSNQISKYSLGSSSTGFAEISEDREGEDLCSSDPTSSALRRQFNSGLMNSTAVDYIFGRHRRSLPDNLNALSGSIVTEESLQSNGAAQAFLTSASIQPISVHDTEVAAARESSAGAEAPLPRFDLSKASYPQFASSYSRSQTYGSWSRDHPKRPDHLTKAGFFYAGEFTIFCFEKCIPVNVCYHDFSLFPSLYRDL